MTEKGFYSFALIAAVLSMIAWILYVVGDSAGTNIDGIEDAGQIFQVLWENRTITYIYGWGGLFGALLTIPYILAFQYAFREYGPWFWLATASTTIGSTLTALGFMAGSLAYVYAIIPIGLAASPEQVGMVWAATQVAGDLIEVTWFVGSFLAYSVGIGLFAYAALRSVPIAKWISWVGIVAGISGIAWLTIFLPILEPIALIPRLINILTIFVWSIAMAIAILRNPVYRETTV